MDERHGELLDRGRADRHYNRERKPHYFRDDMIKWIEKYMDFARPTEEFNGSQGGIWVSGDNGDEYNGRVIYDYYSEDHKNRTFGVDNEWEKELNKRGWYSEWNDAGTCMIWSL